MGKLRPNFSWQKYEGNEEDQKEQFQFQLQQQFIEIANSMNVTINDLSYWTKSRETAFTWINGLPIYTITLPINSGASWVGGTVNTIPLTITAPFFTIIKWVGWLSDGTTAASNTLLLPHLDVGDFSGGDNSIEIVRNSTNIILTSAGANRSAWSGYVTVDYIITKS